MKAVSVGQPCRNGLGLLGKECVEKMRKNEVVENVF